MPSQRNSEKQPPAEGLLAIVQNRIQTDLLDKCCCESKTLLITLYPSLRENNRIVFKSDQLLISNLQKKFRPVIKNNFK